MEGFMKKIYQLFLILLCSFFLCQTTVVPADYEITPYKHNSGNTKD